MNNVSIFFDYVPHPFRGQWWLPSLKLTARPWKWIVGRRSFLFGKTYFQVRLLLVLGRVNVGSTIYTPEFQWHMKVYNAPLFQGTMVVNILLSHCWWKKSCTSLSHNLQGFIHLNWCRMSSINRRKLCEFTCSTGPYPLDLAPWRLADASLCRADERAWCQWRTSGFGGECWDKKHGKLAEKNW